MTANIQRFPDANLMITILRQLSQVNASLMVTKEALKRVCCGTKELILETPGKKEAQNKRKHPGKKHRKAHSYSVIKSIRWRLSDRTFAG